MAGETDSLLLDATERPAVRVYNPHGRGAAVLVCEHASRLIPAALADLGLDEAAQRSHAAWDIGALKLALELMAELDAPLVAARISRLVYDCNRPPDAPDAIPQRSERFNIPGNTGLDPAQLAARVREVYDPFRVALTDTLDRRPVPPVMITIHSFTPVYHGRQRTVELGVLHDADDRVAQSLLREASRRTPLRVEMNQPYSATDGVTHTLRHHAIARGLPNVMIEVRNDLLDTPRGIARIAAMLAPVLCDVVAEHAGATAVVGMADQTR